MNCATCKAPTDGRKFCSLLCLLEADRIRRCGHKTRPNGALARWRKRRKTA